MKKKMARGVSLLLTLVVSAGLLAGCAKEDKPQNGGGGGGAEKRDSIVIATMGETPSLSSTGHNSVAGSYMNLLNYNSLMRVNMEMNPEPCLAESYENISDTEWEFKLHQGVKFHNGQEMKAEDVKASLEWAKGFPEVKQYTDSIASVEVVDDYTVKITTPEPSAIVLNDLAHHANAVVPKKLIDEGHDFDHEPIGTGPYVFKKWNLGTSIEFEAFADYFLGEAPIKNMTWKIIPEGSSRTISLEAGEIDFIIEVETMDAERLQGNDQIAITEFQSTGLNWLMLNNEKPGLDNADVRKAINCAINKEDVIKVALNGMGVVVDSQVPFNLPGYSDANTEGYDLEKAKAYLAQSGVDPAGIQMSIICSNDTKKRAGEVIQSNLKEVGINAQIESMDLATYLSVTTEGDYTAAIGGYTASTMTNYMVGVLHSKSINASNKTRLNSPELDALIDKASTTVDQAAREKILQEASALANELCTQAPLYQPVELRAYNADLEGVEVNASGDLYFEKVKWKN